MSPEDRNNWLAGVLGPLSLIDVSGFPIALALDNSAAVTAGFSEIDTGLRMEADGATDVRCEIVCGAGASSSVAMALAGTWNTLLNAQIPAQPGVLLPDLVHDPQLSVHHGWLREPQLFERGTPMCTEPGRLTLLLELVLLTDEEYSIAADQGIDVLERRLRRRRDDIGDWCRD